MNDILRFEDKILCTHSVLPESQLMKYLNQGLLTLAIRVSK